MSNLEFIASLVSALAWPAAREALDGSVAALNNYAGLVYDATRIASDPMTEVANA